MVYGCEVHVRDIIFPSVMGALMFTTTVSVIQLSRTDRRRGWRKGRERGFSSCSMFCLWCGSNVPKANG